MGLLISLRQVPALLLDQPIERLDGLPGHMLGREPGRHALEGRPHGEDLE